MMRSVYFTYLQQYQKQFPDQFEEVTQSGLNDFLADRYHKSQGKEEQKLKEKNKYLEELLEA